MGNNKIYDIAVVGGGPGGATFARLIASKYSVALLDGKHFSGDGGPEKCCGGLLNPDAQKLFAQFGLGIPLSIMEDPQIFAVRTIDLETKSEKYYNRMYVNINRHKFDLWLASLIPPHVEIIDRAKCIEITSERDAFLLTYHQGGKSNTIRSRYIVGADGARSVVRDTFCPIPIRRYLAIQESYSDNEDFIPEYAVFFDHNITDCYGWINRKDDKIQLGAALYSQTGKQDFEKLRQVFLSKGYPFDKPTKREACLVCRPKRLKEIQTGNGNVFLIGEAAGFVSTSSLEGISNAMHTGAILADAFNKSDNPEKYYRKKTRWLKLNMLLKMFKACVIYTPFLRKVVMKSGVTTIKVRTNPHRTEEL